MDPVFAVILAGGLLFFGLTGLFCAVTFTRTWRRGTAPHGAATTFMDFFPRTVVLVATGAGVVGCVAFAAFWIVLFSGFR